MSNGVPTLSNQSDKCNKLTHLARFYSHRLIDLWCSNPTFGLSGSSLNPKPTMAWFDFWFVSSIECRAYRWIVPERKTDSRKTNPSPGKRNEHWPVARDDEAADIVERIRLQRETGKGRNMKGKSWAVEGVVATHRHCSAIVQTQPSCFAGDSTHCLHQGRITRSFSTMSSGNYLFSIFSFRFFLFVGWFVDLFVDPDPAHSSIHLWNRLISKK